MARLRLCSSAPSSASRVGKREIESVVGQMSEEERKRYVVEYRCADQSASMVAFIPLEGNTSPYDAVDCAKVGGRSLWL